MLHYRYYVIKEGILCIDKMFAVAILMMMAKEMYPFVFSDIHDLIGRPLTHKYVLLPFCRYASIMRKFLFTFSEQKRCHIIFFLSSRQNLFLSYHFHLFGLCLPNNLTNTKYDNCKVQYFIQLSPKEYLIQNLHFETVVWYAENLSGIFCKATRQNSNSLRMKRRVIT